MCPGDTFVLYWWCLDTELDVIEHLKLFITRGIPILTTLTALPLTVLDHFFLWMWYCSKEILPWNRWQTDILICMEEQCPYSWQANVSIAFWVRITSALDIWMLQLLRLRFSHFCLTLSVFFPKARGEWNSYFLSSHPPLDLWATAPTSTLCLLLRIYLCVWEHFSPDWHHKEMFSSTASSHWKPAWQF